MLGALSEAVSLANWTIGVGFGTAALGGECEKVVRMALDAGFRKFDTAEAPYWYDQDAVGAALRTFFDGSEEDDDGHYCDDDVYYANIETEAANKQMPGSCKRRRTCDEEGLQVSTKLPPWELTSITNIRERAAASREVLVGFCDTHPRRGGKESRPKTEEGGEAAKRTGRRVQQDDHETFVYPLDVYYIHAPQCWPGWHSHCDGVKNTLPLREVWRAMEAVAGIDKSARRIGLSNVRPDELMDIIDFVEERQKAHEENDEDLPYPPPRIPDALQIYADPLEPARELRRICKEYGIEFVSYSTLGTQHVMRHKGKNPVLTHPIVQELATKYEKSVAEVVLSWALQGGMSVIPRSNKPTHIRELANLLTEPPFLTEEDFARMETMGQRH